MTDTNKADVGQMPDQPNLLNEERGVPSVNKRKKGNNVTKVAGVSALAVVVAAMVWMSMKPKEEVQDKPQESLAQTRRGLPALELPASAPPPPPPPVQTPEQPVQAGAPMGTQPMASAQPQARQEPTEAELLLERRKRAPILAVAGNASPGGQSAGGTGPAYQGGQQPQGGFGGTNDEGPDRNGIGANLQGTGTQLVNASMLGNRNYLIAKGTFLDCALITAISSQQPGMTSCRLTRNIYSDNGKVLLLERGSIVEGEYRSGQMRQGMNRIFVLWTRVRTPRGVAVQLDSPGTDELGRSGLSGWVDTHFWQRFGGTLMLSLIDDAAQYAVERQRSRSNGDSFTFDGAGDAASNAAAIALQNSINIPPTMNKNQGDLINIYVARDLDFRSVYDLRAD